MRIGLTVFSSVVPIVPPASAVTVRLPGGRTGFLPAAWYFRNMTAPTTTLVTAWDDITDLVPWHWREVVDGVLFLIRFSLTVSDTPCLRLCTRLRCKRHGRRRRDYGRRGVLRFTPRHVYAVPTHAALLRFPLRHFVLRCGTRFDITGSTFRTSCRTCAMRINGLLLATVPLWR